GASVASSAYGIKLVAAGFRMGSISFYALPIFTSADSGMTWTQTSAPSNYWSSVASSADATKLVAVSIGNSGSIYTSPGSGATWRQTSAPSNWWLSVASSADGSKLVAAAGDCCVEPGLNSASMYSCTNGSP